MTKFKVVDFEEQTTTGGKELKKLTLLPEGQQNTEPRVTMWSTHPDFNSVVAGGEVSGVLEKKDSGTPIPAHPGKNYVNRTLLPEGSVSSPTPSSSTLEAKVDRILEIVEKWTKDPPF